VASRTADLSEQPFASRYRRLDGGFVWYHLPWDVQCDLEQCDRRHISGRQLIHKAVTVRIESRSEALF
jgi:hypothetical protein